MPTKFAIRAFSSLTFFASLDGRFGSKRWRKIARPDKPSLSPVRIDCSRTESMILGFAYNTVKYDAGILHADQFAGFFVNNFMYAAQHSVNSAAIRKHF